MELDKIFSIDRYGGPDNFCDRDAELARLIEMFELKRNGVLYSYRRLGKTGLIQHYHHKLDKRKKVITVYLDIMDTMTDQEFVNKLVAACLSAIEKKKKGFIKQTLEFFGQLKPSMSFDPITNMPNIQLEISTPAEIKLSLDALYNIMSSQSYNFQIAIDEFQQISKYEKGTVMDATLRSYFNKAPNIHYVFLGSERHLLLNLFQPDKPLFSSVEFIHLDYIPFKSYFEFIKNQFSKAKRTITDDAIKEVLDWTNCHTFYTQYFCSKLIGTNKNKITLAEVQDIKSEILFQYEVIYINYKKLLRKIQWKVLVAVAKEGEVIEYTSKDFLNKYKLSQSSVKQAVGTLVKKDLLIEILSAEKSRYQVYDVFLWRWAERYG